MLQPVLILLFFILNPKPEKHILIKSFDCPAVNLEVKSNRLKDKMSRYIHKARLNGIKRCKDLNELNTNKNLIQIRENDYYIIDKLTHSYPYLTKDAMKLLNKIGAKFNEELKRSNLEGTKFIITSLTRTEESVQRLLEININASPESAHMYGQCFDISYSRFFKPYTRFKPCHLTFLKETLASVILKLKKSGECWALTEIKEPCYHIVKRKNKFI